jgi:hypothetical protein
MGMTAGGPDLIQDGLVLCLDASDRNSYVSGSSTWFDLSGNNNSGSLVNGPTFNTGSLGSIVFDGTNDYVDCGSTPLGYTDDVTVSVWFSLLSFANIYNYIAVKYGGGRGWILNTSNNVLRVDGRAGGSYRVVESNVPVNLNQWYDFTFVKQGIVWMIYANGTLNTSQSFVGDTSIFSSSNLTVSDSYGPSSINGRVGNFKVYNRALSAQEVLQNYNATKGRFGLK